MKLTLTGSLWVSELSGTQADLRSNPNTRRPLVAPSLQGQGCRMMKTLAARTHRGFWSLVGQFKSWPCLGLPSHFALQCLPSALGFHTARWECPCSSDFRESGKPLWSVNASSPSKAGPLPTFPFFSKCCFAKHHRAHGVSGWASQGSAESRDSSAPLV